MIDRLFTDPMGFALALLLMTPALLAAVTIHELAHGWVADRLGDPTARQQGRLTINPLPHIDPLGALCFVLAGFGWAKPVPVNPYNFRRPTRDMAWVAAAGPASNFVAAFVALMGLVVVRRSLALPFLGEPVGEILLWAYQFNLALAIFNLLPLPPLDGGHFLPHILPPGSGAWLRQLEQYGPFILLLLVMTGGTRHIVGPVFQVVSGLYVWLVASIL